MALMIAKRILIEPSLLSADFGRLAEEARRMEEAGADAIHVDIMDGHFVPNLTLGPKAVAAVNRATSLFLDVHLMLYNPYDFVEVFIQAGADRITFHFEATEDIEDTLEFIKRCGKQAGLSFRPETSFALMPRFLPLCDSVLIMTVHPGFGGQEFLMDTLEKIRLTRHFCDQHKLVLDLQVDGGINLETGRECVRAGANTLVSGHYLMNQPDLKQAIEQLRSVR
jgi:ribulose-phosphate 3-epimerase